MVKTRRKRFKNGRKMLQNQASPGSRIPGRHSCGAGDQTIAGAVADQAQIRGSGGAARVNLQEAVVAAVEMMM